MSLELTQVDTVVAGRFNPHIINPLWLVKQGIVEGEEEAKYKGTVDISDRETRFGFEIGGYEWQVSNHRLVVRSPSCEDPGPVVRKVLKDLPHTPIRALGHNFTYESPLSEWSVGLPQLGALSAERFREHFKLRQAEWGVSLGCDDGVTLNVRVSVDESSAAISFNFHREVSSAEGASECTQQFEADLRCSRGFLDDLLSQEVDGELHA